MRTLLSVLLGILMVGCQPPVTAEPDAGGVPSVDAGVDAGLDDAGVDAGLLCTGVSHLVDGGCVTEIDWVRSRFGPEGRDHHATWLWPDGDGGAVLIVAGGIDKWLGDGFYDTRLARIGADGVVQPWEHGEELPTWQMGMAVEASGDRAYLVGGMGVVAGSATPTALVQSVSRLPDGTPGAWREEAPLPEATFYASVSRVGDWLFVTGGRVDGGRALDGVWRTRIGADGVLEPWTTLAPLPFARTHHGAFVDGDYLFLIAGFDAASWNSTQDNFPDLLVAKVDPATGALSSWTSLPIGFTASSFSVTVDDGWVYVLGGFDGSFRLLSAVRRARLNHDGTIGEFESLTSLPVARAHVRQTPIRDGVIYTFGGSFLSATHDQLHLGILW